MKKIAVICFSLLLIPILSFTALRLHYSAQVMDAQQFCESIIPKIEAEYEKTGSYPDNLDSILSPSQRLPTLLRKRGPSFYESQGDIYYFLFQEPMAIAFKRCYNSRMKSWMDYD